MTPDDASAMSNAVVVQINTVNVFLLVQICHTRRSLQPFYSVNNSSDFDSVILQILTIILYVQFSHLCVQFN